MVILERSLSSFLWWDGSWTWSSTFPLLALLQGSWNSSTSLVNVPFHPGWDPVLSSSGLGYIEIHFTLDRIFQEKQEIFLTIRSRRFKFYFNFIYSLIKSSWVFYAQILLYPSPFHQKISLLQFCLHLCEICSLILSPLFLVIGNSDISNSAELDHWVPHMK